MYPQNESNSQVPSAPVEQADASSTQPAAVEEARRQALLELAKAVEKLAAGAERQRDAETYFRSRAEKHFLTALCISLVGASVVSLALVLAAYFSALVAVGLAIPLATPWGIAVKLAAGAHRRHFDAAQRCRRAAARFDVLASAAQLATTDEARTELALMLAREAVEIIEKDGDQSGKADILSRVGAKVLGWIPRRTNRRLVPALGG